MRNEFNYDKNSVNQLLTSVENLQDYEVVAIKDSLSTFFVDWVNASHEMGLLDREIHLAHTNNYSMLQELLTCVLEYKKPV